jgi:Arc/MetJ-type ribon-helix-helix transcriptional regulator
MLVENVGRRVTARSAGAIPLRYGSGMTIQMTVRLPDDVASYIDERVSEGAAGSRAEIIARAVRHERELEILAALRDQGETLYPDLAGLVDWAAERPLDLE